ncbi:hypothetical protein B0T26DRAFT_678028 [Lasiosphaeria miniovina]|uniref:DUF7704 domain-containing protein n=1 Tax=Lasiosphaeria miniovina TaxID=1954250 RepID=A0AA40AD65_9PEZI|nr:uncharacterized protein B0T26DRAFT_678028 [Lasiosphaeria miniovina]KAK0713731.1 hypothetical protein B0T26DRAFT_678028 [Lasiosphaeria miniovina]
MARSTLPTFPLIVFGIIEPALLIVAYVTAMRDPATYFADQAPNYAVNAGQFVPQALGLTLQMANVLLLLALLAWVCCWSRDPATARGFLVAVAFADWGHLYAVYRTVGLDLFLNPAAWNGNVAGNIGASAVLNVLRWLTVFGVFGPVQAAAVSTNTTTTTTTTTSKAAAAKNKKST